MGMAHHALGDPWCRLLNWPRPRSTGFGRDMEAPSGVIRRGASSSVWRIAEELKSGDWRRMKHPEALSRPRRAGREDSGPDARRPALEYAERFEQQIMLNSIEIGPTRGAHLDSDHVPTDPPGVFGRRSQNGSTSLQERDR